MGRPATPLQISAKPSGLPAAASGPAAPRWRIKSQTLRCRSGFRLRILTPVRAKTGAYRGPRLHPFDDSGSRPHNGSRGRSFSRTKRGIRTSPAGSDARKAAQIVKERWFLLPGQPQTCNNKAYCNNIIMYLSRRIHPEIPGGDTGLIGIG
jgi:hypothetical protein